MPPTPTPAVKATEADEGVGVAASPPRCQPSASAPSGASQSGIANAGWTWEEHELSEGPSCIVYDERGKAIADHLDRRAASLIAAAPDLYDGCNALLGLLQLIASRPDINDDLRSDLTDGHRIDEAKAALAKARGQ